MNDALNICSTPGCGGIAQEGCELCEKCGLRLSLRSTTAQLREAHRRNHELDARCSRLAHTIEVMVDSGRYTKQEGP